MKRSFRETDVIFAREVRRFLDRYWPETGHSRRRNGAAERRWFQALAERGWSVPSWPVAHGGTGWRRTQLFIWEQARARAAAPALDPGGVLLAGPGIFTAGTKAQQARYLPAIRAADARWAHALGDAAVSAGAVRARESDGKLVLDGFQPHVVGLEGATHMVGFANMVGEEEVPTGAPPGAPTLFLVRLEARGIRRRGAATLHFKGVNGEMLGQPGGGRELLERVLAFALRLPGATAQAEVLLARLDRALGELPDGQGGVLAEDTIFKSKAAALGVRFDALRALEWRLLTGQDAGALRDALAEVLGVQGAELCVAASSLLNEALGYYAMPLSRERRGDNEPPLGGGYASPAGQGMLTGLFGYLGTLDSRKDRLARRLFGNYDPGAGDVGH